MSMSLLNIIQVLVGPTVTIVRETKRAVSNRLSYVASRGRKKQSPRAIHISDAAEIAERKRNANEWYEAGRPSDILRGSYGVSPTSDAAPIRKAPHLRKTGRAFKRRVLPYIRLPLLLAFIIGVWWLIVFSLAKH